MALAKFGKCFKLDCHKEVMPYGVYTYALDILETI